MNERERKLIFQGGIVGMLAYLFPMTDTYHFHTRSPFACILAAATFLAVTLLQTAHYCYQNRRNDTLSIGRKFLLLFFIVFYSPILLIDDPVLAFFMFAGAHGLQYDAILFFTTLNSGEVQSALKVNRINGLMSDSAIVTLFIGIACLHWVAWQSTYSISRSSYLSDYKSALIGFHISVTIVHYWIDSRIWKMSKPDSREFVRLKLDFLFSGK